MVLLAHFHLCRFSFSNNLYYKYRLFFTRYICCENVQLHEAIFRLPIFKSESLLEVCMGTDVSTFENLVCL